MRFNRSHFRIDYQEPNVHGTLYRLKTTMNLWDYLKGVMDIADKVVMHGFTYNKLHDQPVPEFDFITDGVTYSFCVDGTVYIVGDNEQINFGTIIFDALV